MTARIAFRWRVGSCPECYEAGTPANPICSPHGHEWQILSGDHDITVCDPHKHPGPDPDPLYVAETDEEPWSPPRTYSVGGLEVYVEPYLKAVALVALALVAVLVLWRNR